MQRIAVLGAGSWGTALALRLATNGHEVRLWGHRAQHIAKLHRDRENARYLPGVLFPDNLSLNDDLQHCISDVDLILLVVPSQYFSTLLRNIAPWVKKTPIMWAIKGFEHGSGQLLSEVFTKMIGVQHPHAVLAGPSFAKEVAFGQPTAVTIATAEPHNSNMFAQPFHGSNFLCYTSGDIIGAQIGGAVKNVIAIATGIADGMGYGANTRAALITRGLHEITRLANRLGAQPQTLAGLAGMGDLVLTATDNQSRNRRFGLALGGGQSAEDAKLLIGQVVEGESAASDTWALACRHQVRMPIVEHVYRLLQGELSLESAMQSLTNRDLKDEIP